MSPYGVTRRGLIRRIGLLGALGVAGWSYPVAAESGGDSPYTVEDPITIESFDGTDIEASFYR